MSARGIAVKQRQELNRMKNRRNIGSTILLIAYFFFLAAPLVWMLSMSFKTNSEILTTRSLIPIEFTTANYEEIFTEPFWRDSFANSIFYVMLNTIITLVVSLPAAYAFSRYEFRGDNHLFF